MRNKIRLLALIYGPEDHRIMSDWMSEHSDEFDIVAWSQHLTVPIQSAVAHYADELNDCGIDGFLIDSHHHYDPIVIKRLSNIVSPKNLSIYSASDTNIPLVGVLPVRSFIEVQANALALPEFPQFQKIAV